MTKTLILGKNQRTFAQYNITNCLLIIIPRTLPRTFAAHCAHIRQYLKCLFYMTLTLCDFLYIGSHIRTLPPFFDQRIAQCPHNIA